jgi:Flp pilus assembly protein TadB
MADLTGLLSDLPDDEPAQPQLSAAARRQQRKMLRVQLERERLHLRHERHRQRKPARRNRARSLGLLLLLVAGVIWLIMLVHTLTHSIGAWLLLGLIAFLWLRRDNSRYHGS